MRVPFRHSALDQADSFGWISIALHWVTAAVIVAMWVIGKMMANAADASGASLRNLHVTLGLAAWLLLAGRVVWRMAGHHPRAAGLSDLNHRLARTTHYLMLVTLTALIVSGPVIAWLGRGGATGSIAYATHYYAGNSLLLLVIVHTLAAMKHLMFHDDDSVVRMLWPKSRR